MLRAAERDAPIEGAGDRSGRRDVEIEHGRQPWRGQPVSQEDGEGSRRDEQGGKVHPAFGEPDQRNLKGIGKGHLLSSRGAFAESRA